ARYWPLQAAFPRRHCLLNAPPPIVLDGEKRNRPAADVRVSGLHEPAAPGARGSISNCPGCHAVSGCRNTFGYDGEDGRERAESDEKPYVSQPGSADSDPVSSLVDHGSDLSCNRDQLPGPAHGFGARSS